MNTLEQLLCATDLSANSRLAVGRASRIAAQAGCNLTVMHVVSQSAIDQLQHRLGRRAAQLEPRLIEQLRTELQQLVDQCTAAAGVMADRHLTVGRVVDEIVAQVERQNAGLLVVGSHGSGLLRNLLPGATADKLVRKASCPVLVVKTPAARGYRRALIAVDFSDAALGALQAARQVAPEADLVLLHAFELPYERSLHLAGADDQSISRYRAEARGEALEQLAAFANRAGLGTGSVGIAAVHGQPSRIIVDHAREGDIDLVVVGRHGRSAIEKLLLGSVTQNVLAEANSDVLIAGW